MVFEEGRSGVGLFKEQGEGKIGDTGGLGGGLPKSRIEAYYLVIKLEYRIYEKRF